MGRFIESLFRAFEAFGAVGVCGTLGLFVAIAVIHSAMKKKDER